MEAKSTSINKPPQIDIRTKIILIVSRIIHKSFAMNELEYILC
jgi:hypothetical protein